MSGGRQNESVVSDTADSKETGAMDVSYEQASTPPSHLEDPSIQDLTSDKDGGVMKEVTREGEGDTHPHSGDTVFVHYVGTLLDGTKFDSSRDRGEKFSFTLGQGQVIKAWDLCVATMKRNEICKVTCKPEYGYGEKGSGDTIPPNSTLVFEIELFDWRGEDVSEEKDGGVTRTILTVGEKYKTPNDGALLDVHITGYLGDRIFQDRDEQFNLGEGSDIGIIDGVEMALKKFTSGEKSRLKVKAAYAYGSKGHEEFNIPPNTDLEYEVTLKKFEKAKESWQMGAEEKLEQSEIVKEKGTKYFKDNKFKEAARCYKKIVDYLQYEKSEGEQATKRVALMVAAHLNLALCALKQNENTETIEQCDKALELQPNNEKGLFRKGMALMNLKEYETAIRDFKKCLEVDPANKAALNQIAIAQQRIKADFEREKKIYGGMFQKFAEMDSKRLVAAGAADGDQFSEIGNWDNRLAEGMLPLEQERAAFEDTVGPEPRDSRTV